MTHGHFAALYDFLMEDAPYESWLDYAAGHLPEGGRVLDLACGTGTLTMMMAERQYTVSGVDISRDMLTVAEEKSRSQSVSIPFVLQDMRELNGFSGLDGVTLFCDGINYLDEESDVKQTFSQVASALKPGGIFLFDAHTPYKMTHVFNRQLYGENGEELSYLWFCEPGEFPLSVYHTLTFFVKNGTGLYERRDEEQCQRTFPPEYYKKWLEQAGFTNVEISAGFGQKQLDEEDNRMFFKAVKKQ